MPPLRMGQGFTYTTGAITSEHLNALLQEASLERGIPFQRSVSGRDTGTDAMAGVFAAIACAATSVGFPIRNMHTISEPGHTGDVLASIHALHALLQLMESRGLSTQDFKNGHPRLDQVTMLEHVTPEDEA